MSPSHQLCNGLLVRTHKIDSSNSDGPTIGPHTRSGNPQEDTRKKERNSSQYRFYVVRLVSSVLLVALSTVNWLARRRHKRYFRFCAAVGAFDFRHLPRGTPTSILVTHLRIPPSLFSSYTKDSTRRDNRHGSREPFPSSTQVRSLVYCARNSQDCYKK
jgi:hypothetical protein